MNDKHTSAFLEEAARQKTDFRVDDFKVLVGDRLLMLTPEMVAEMFASLYADEQARFFNHVDRVASSWHGGGLEWQLQYITDDDGLTLAGRRVMQSIGDYSHWGLVPHGDRSFDDVEQEAQE